MRLYSKVGTSSIVNEEHGTFEADEDGGFELPHELGLHLHGTHINGEQVWETDGERSLRLVAEEDARRRDPATLLEAVERMASTRQVAEKPRTSKRT